ncbi:TonB-dependent receptor [Sphingomonas xinjiangensis]|uniref:Outer membrane receptor protein involved in Fe transport n=1 Tax=Sphingomonas xinjiangensis TaxID=643568 RepID=A0A840YSZ6_9SPHN|nr:TonB-dependent receptor [Sphingomonas xinjiangensis]MBB5712831.1 outer membrane receptor protein involved in Fe transport [Sphingomonas xinjiangensis]
MKWEMGAAILAIVAGTNAAYAQTEPAPTEERHGESGEAGRTDDIVVVGQATTFANNRVTPPMLERQSALTSVNAVIGELPGVSVTEGDAFGSSSWVTTISIRGFNSGGGGQQIGTTLDGMPNGGSGYGGGSRANRFIDVLDLGTVNVSQGTADISSRSNEALGGTLDYVTSDPLQESRVRFTGAAGDFSARKLYARVDTGEIAPDTRAWISGATAYNRDFIGGAGETRRDHLSAKLLTRVADVDLTAFVSYDDADEPEFGSVSLAQFLSDPKHDALTDEWVGIPYIDQAYRAGSRALRKNLFGYLKARTEVGELSMQIGAYGHSMTGRGDWLPPYLVDVVNDSAGQPESEFTGGSPAIGVPNRGTFFFVTPSGAKATMIPGCTGSAGVPAESSPACYAPGSTPVMSYRHTHYDTKRFGFTGDLEWTHAFGGFENQLRAGYWYEHARVNQRRDWHKVTNALIGPAFDGTPYYTQFSTDYPADELMYYVQDALTLGPVTARFGVKQFFLDQGRIERIGAPGSTRIDSHSKPLVSAGLAYRAPIDGLEVFAGYSQNFAAIGNGPLGQPAQTIQRLKPETANNVEVGARYSTNRIQASLTLYDIKFQNQIVSIASNLVTGIDYLEQQDRAYLNVGGVKSRGVEAALAYRISGGLTLSGNYTYNKATYIGTGNAAQDKDVGVAPGVQVINSPRNMWVLSADYARSIFKGGLSAKFVGDRNIDTLGLTQTPSFTLLNGFIGADLGGLDGRLKGVSVTVQGTNLTNERYLAGSDGGSAFLGAPRTVTASLSLDF